MNVKSPWVWGSGILVAGLLFLCCSGCMVASLSERVIHPERVAVKAYLQKHAHDPSSIEYVEWGEVVRYPAQKIGAIDIPAHENITVTIRSKNAFGAKVSSTQRYIIEDGKVTAVSDY